MPRQAAVELAPDVFRIPTAPSGATNSFAFRDDDGRITLVDCGRGPGRIVQALEELSSDPSEVTTIVLTHAHPDHVAGLAGFAARTGARVAAHEREAPYVRAGRPPARDGSHRAGRVVDLLTRRFAPTEVSMELADGDKLPVAGGIRVIHTPGHTPGHISLMHERSGVLIVGDVLTNVRSLRFAPAYLSTNARRARQSATALAGLDFDVAAFSHGPEMRDGASHAVRSLLSGYEVAR